MPVANSKTVEKMPSRQLSAIVADRILRHIRENNLEPGDKLPSQNALREMYGVGTQTVRHGLAMLIHQGRVQARHGAGYFVMSPRAKLDLARPSLRSQTGEPLPFVFRPLGQTEYIAQTDRLASLLDLDRGIAIVRRRRLMILGDCVVGMETVNIPANIAHNFSEGDFAECDFLDVLARRAETKVGSISLSLHACEISAFDADLLDVPEGKVMMHRIEVYLSRSQEPVLMARTAIDSDHVELSGIVSVN